MTGSISRAATAGMIGCLCCWLGVGGCSGSGNTGDAHAVMVYLTLTGERQGTAVATAQRMCVEQLLLAQQQWLTAMTGVLQELSGGGECEQSARRMAALLDGARKRLADPLRLRDRVGLVLGGEVLRQAWMAASMANLPAIMSFERKAEQGVTALRSFRLRCPKQARQLKERIDDLARLMYR